MGWSKPDKTRRKLLESISSFFNLGIVASYNQTGGYASHNYFVTTSSGEYVFKIILGRSLADLKKEVIYLERLKQYGFPTAYYIKAPSGSHLYNMGGVLAIVLPKMPGKNPKPSKNISKEVGRNLAKLHLIPSNSLPNKEHWLKADYLATAISTAKNNLKKEKVKQITKAYNSVKKFDLSLFPQTIIHGDLSPKNCLFENKNLSVFLDWDEVGIGVSLLDFAMAVVKFCFGERRFNSQFYHSFTQSYNEIRPLKENEKQNMEIAIKYAGVTLSVWRLLQFDLYHPDEKLKNIYNFFWKVGLDKWKLP